MHAAVKAAAKSLGLDIPEHKPLPTPQEIDRLLQAAKDAPTTDRPESLRKLADALAGADRMTVAHYATEVKSAGLATKTDFMQAIHEAAKSPTTDKRGPTHDELRDRWLAQHLNTAYGLGDWRRYDAGIWHVVSDSTIAGEIEPIAEAAKSEGVRPARHVLSSVIELARVKVFVPDAKWDADPDILVCRNGALHIPTRTLLSHSPEHYATSGLSFDYDVTATCSTWEYCLNSTVPDAADFLQEFAGHALTTSTHFEIALWLYGPKGSGKSTIIGGLQTMLGTRAGLLGLGDIERSSFALTNLPGKTLVVATEQPATYIKTTHILNAIISGEPVTVDIKYRNPVVITPRAKLAWAMNELPRVPDAGSGLFRRVKVVRFPELPASQRDPQIKEAVTTEGAGILNWALDGLARLNARGRFDIPPCVQSATDDFEHNNDIPALFVAECCNVGPDYTTQATPLYDAYRNWCLGNGHKPQSSTTLAEDWRRLGFERYSAGGRNFWRGVAPMSKQVTP